jgi:hypothetical protein
MHAAAAYAAKHRLGPVRVIEIDWWCSAIMVASMPCMMHVLSVSHDVNSQQGSQKAFTMTKSASQTCRPDACMHGLFKLYTSRAGAG